MSFFPGAQKFVINGGHFVNNHNGPTGIDILRESSTPEAIHDAPRAYSPRCFPGTRKQYIEDILHWAIPGLGDAPSPLYWMRGPAGVGKSAIAQTCAEELKRQKRLGATFFFSIDGRDQPEGFFSSVAYQLSTIYPAYRDLVDKKVSQDKTIVDKALSFQFQYLIEEPLRELGAQGKGIGKRIAVLVDGLDECEGVEAQCDIIRIVAEAVADKTLPLCWAFFSRPDSHIEATFNSPTISPHCHKITLPISGDANGEVEHYLKSGFADILRRWKPSVPTEWPSAGDRKIVVSAAGGSFIYATTVIRYVGHLGALGPQKRLRNLIEVILDRRKLGLNPDTSTDAPFAELDAFYTLILRRIPKDAFLSVHLLLALMCRRRASSAIMAANILGLSKDEFETVCSHANAAVHLRDLGTDLEFDSAVSASCSYTRAGRDIVAKLSDQVYRHLGGEVSFYHKSFADFLLDSTRSGDYCVKGSEALANHFIKVHLDYDRSFCWHGTELALTPGVPDSASSLSCPSTNELVNSVIKAFVYRTLNSEDSENFSAFGEVGGLNAACDFRKHLHIATHFTSMLSPGSIRSTRSQLWGCECRTKCFPGTYIVWISRTGFPKFSVPEFKLMIKQRQQANIIQPYHRGLTSHIKSLFHDKSREHVESAVYRIGHGEKSTFWYWEINYELRHYREFRTVDFSKGKKVYKEEKFDSWLWY